MAGGGGGAWKELFIQVAVFDCGSGSAKGTWGGAGGGGAADGVRLLSDYIPCFPVFPWPCVKDQLSRLSFGRVT